MANPSVLSATSWPTSVPPVGHPRHAELLTKWCLEQAPQHLRGFPVVHRHLVVLLLLTRHHLEGALHSTRVAYSKIRSELADTQTPETIAAVLAATAAVGQEYAQALAFVEAMWQEHAQ